MWKRFLLVAVIIGCAFSCRDIQPFQQLKLIQGYELDGIVTSTGSMPVVNADVRLYYNYDIVGTTPIDTQKVIVTNPLNIVDVAVYTPAMHRVRQLFLGYMPVGPVPRLQWDGLNDTGAVMPSGKYLVRYALDTVVVKFSTEILEGTHTSTTDTLGRFTILSDRFPIGEVFDSYLLNNTYDATYRVRSEVDVVVRKLGIQTVQTIPMLKDKPTNAVFTLE